MEDKLLKEINRDFFKQCGIKGGRSRSKAKVKASRQNGKLGGRPKGSKTKVKQDGL